MVLNLDVALFSSTRVVVTGTGAMAASALGE
jgi:hypothetical protein